MSNLFEIASRRKYRFPFKGLITAEDLWDLSLVQLDGVYKTLSKTAKADGEESLLSEHKADIDLANMIEIVKHVFTIKQEEASARKAAAENAEKRARILEVIEQKQVEALHSMSEEELKKLLDSMA